MNTRTPRALVALVAGFSLIAVACGSDGESDGDGGNAEIGGEAVAIGGMDNGNNGGGDDGKDLEDGFLFFDDKGDSSSSEDDDE